MRFWSAFMKKLLIIVLFGLIPLWAVYFTLGAIIDFSAEQKKTDYASQFRNHLFELTQKACAERFYFNLYLKIFAAAQGNPDKANLNLTKISGEFFRRFSDRLNIYTFDTTGSLKKSGKLSQQNHFIIGKLWDCLTETEKYRNDDEQGLLKKLQHLFGGECSVGFFKIQEGQLISLRKRKERGWLFWKRFKGEKHAGMLVFHLPAVDSDKILVSTNFKQTSDLSLEFWPVGKMCSTFRTGLPVDGEPAKKLLENQMTDLIELNQRIWAMARTGSGVFIASSAGLDQKKVLNQKGTLNLIVFLLTLALLTFLLNPRLNLQTVYISIRMKLASLVLISIAIPVFGLIFYGTLSLADYHKVLFTAIENEQRQFLSSIEDEFANSELKFLNASLKFFEETLTSFSHNAFATKAAALVDSGSAVRVELRALNGELINLADKKGYFEGLEKTHDAFSRYCIQRHLSHRLEQEGIKLLRPPDSTLTGIFESSDFGFSQILEAPGRSHRFKFGNNEYLWFWALLEKTGHPAAVITILQSRDLARENFLNEFLQTHPEISAEMGIYNSRRRSWLKAPPVLKNQSEKLVSQAVVEEKSLITTLADADSERIAIALPGVVLAPFSMVHMPSDRLMQAQMHSLELVLKIGILFILIITLFVAQLLSQTFLKPVNLLKTGLQAVQRRVDPPRMAFASNDELGELGEAFNQMVDDLKEMQLAQVVQESLFPEKRVQIPGYEFFQINRPATDLGGDYCDIIDLGKGLWLILIGDVSGHGTSAALAMAMAKAAIFKAVRDQIEFSSLPELISSIMLTALGRKKMMTMLFALLDTHKHRLRLINAGHNWPIIITPENGIREINLSGLPLGIRKNRQTRPEVVLDLAENEMLFAYTDALIEATNLQKMHFGHPRVFTELERCKNLDAPGILAHMETVWRDFLQNQRAEDDLTMIVLQRKGGRR